MVKFIVLSTQRSGSTFLGTLLDSHPQIVCCEELFMPKNENAITYRTYRTASAQRKVSHVLKRKQLIYAYLSELFANLDHLKAAGFKVMYGQVRRYAEIVEWCKDFDVRVIHLIRRNGLKAIVSRQIAKRRGVYLSSTPLEPVRIKLNIANLLSELDELQAMVATYREKFSASPCIEVHYEELLDDDSGEMERILAFLDVDLGAHLTSGLVKTSADSLGELIDNYEEVWSTVRGTPYEHFLD